jgi:hypothetical protein
VHAMAMPRLLQPMDADTAEQMGGGATCVYVPRWQQSYWMTLLAWNAQCVMTPLLCSLYLSLHGALPSDTYTCCSQHARWSLLANACYMRVSMSYVRL